MDLRFAATAIPAGLPENPLQMVIEPVSTGLYIEPEVTQEPGVGKIVLPVSSTQQELDLEQAILEFSNVTVDVVPIDNPADALMALCNETDKVSAVWVSGVSFSTALAQNCGEPIFIVQKRFDNRLQSGENGLIILSRTIDSPDLNSLNERTFCRLGITDFYSWILPLMIFRANNVDPATFESIMEYRDSESLFEAVVSGDCIGAGISGIAYQDIIDKDETLADQVSIGFNTPPIPYAVLIYPVEMQLGIRVALNEGLQAMMIDEDASELLRLFLGQDQIEFVDLQDFDEYLTFLDQVGLDFSILGN